MAYKKRITRSQRRHMDYLRLEGLKVGKVYQNRLIKLRRKEIKRVLSQCMAYGGIEHWDDVIDMHLDEAYLMDWYRGLYAKAGLPKAKAVARDLSLGKASPEEGYWETELMRYAEQRAGSEIVLVQGTLKDELIKITRGIMTEDRTIPIEKLARQIFSKYKEIELWQARRIAQTETMIGLSQAGAIAAETLDVGFTKQWSAVLIRTRESHLQMDGMEVDQDELFFVGDEQAPMRWPHDDSLGAPAGEIINCACDVIRRPK